MGVVWTLSKRTGKKVLMDETEANGYYRLSGRYVIGPPINDAAALRRPFWKSVEEAANQPVNWKPFPTIPKGTTDYVVAPGYYLNEDPSKALFVPPYDRRVVLQGLPGKPMVLRSRGDIIQGYAVRLLIDNVTVEAMNPGVYGKCPGRFLSCDDHKWIEVYNSKIVGTSGIALGTGGSGKWQGDPTKGERLRIQRNEIRDIRGQKSDGSYDAANPLAVSPIRSNFGPTHSDSVRWNPSVPSAERTAANKADPNKFGVLGWEAAQFVQIRHQPGMIDSAVTDNYIYQGWGTSRVEDNQSCYAGSGGTPASPFVFARNYQYGGQGLDWNYRPGLGMTYNGTNQITLNAVGYQNPSQTRYSGSGAGITDDSQQSSVVGSYELNEAYIQFIDQITVGNSAVHTDGHHVLWDGVKVYKIETTDTGDLLTFDHAFIQVTRYQTRTAVNLANQVKETWGNNTWRNLRLYSGTTEGNIWPANDGNIGFMLLNGGVYDEASSRKLPTLPRGFEAQLFADWLAGRQAAGLTIGLRG